MVQPDNRKRPRDSQDAEREAKEQSARPSGLDKDFGGAGYAGPGGFGGGYAGKPADQQREGIRKDARPVPRKPNKEGRQGLPVDP